MWSDSDSDPILQNDNSQEPEVLKRNKQAMDVEERAPKYGSC
jgi:hypothetical protein